MNINSLKDQEITRAAALIQTEFEAAAKTGLVGPNKTDMICVATWVVAALLLKIDEMSKGPK
ncbi:hypothetical protein E0H46_31910 [Rhizobium leguminosarum bv. viciae]|nr:hypothetical protein E0H46_31910 [Rhizobium leguminosarum bv. viciae]